jgi:hypothetical protein
MMGSEETGCKVGIAAADNGLCVAAAEGGFVVVLAVRDGLTSCVLFFLDRLGPAALAEVLDFCGGLTGDDSLEGIGEFVADMARLGSGFFVVGIEDVDVSRVVLDIVDVLRSVL